MSCGIPRKLWDDPALGPFVRGALGSSAPPLAEGRNEENAALPYKLNAFTTADGAKVVNSNCLTCHGGKFDGEVIVGLGDATADFTKGLGGGAGTGLDPSLFASLGLTVAEEANLQKLLRLGEVAGPGTKMRTVGLNPAEQLTGILISHHDRDTLAWLDTPVGDVTQYRDENGDVIEGAMLTSDPPPWWRAHKKNALFYNAMARGQHRGTMALATAVCVDTIDEARRVDDLFKDIHAFVASVRPPTYGRSVDATLAKEGKQLFEKTCAGCHGTYSDDPRDDAGDTYPNLLIPLNVVGTDSAVADAPMNNPDLVGWYNGAFYGQITEAVPDDPFVGYVPPPLDGIWATAPFLHNGSVPTVELLLNSKARPTYWKRVDLDDENFDETAMGWPFEEVSYSQADAPEEERLMIYDTTQYSQTNGGHTFGDHLTDGERRAVIEYLKTL
jgi:mono/diheme cytochrome c family protein